MTALNPPILSWRGKRVWIVGASSGIGAALAQSLLEEGASVVLSARRSDELLAVAGSAARATVVPFDASDTEAWKAAYQSSLASLGQIDLLILGAARYDPMDCATLDLTSAEKSFDLNVLGVYRGLSVVIPDMLEKGGGGLALVGSISAYTGLPRALVYGATKAALRNLAQTLYFELAPKGIAVYLISPGFVETPMTSKNDFAMPGLMTPAQAAAAIRHGLERGRFEIRFPRGFSSLLWWVSLLPDRLRFFLLHKITGM